jgi:hypothetical protein
MLPTFLRRSTCPVPSPRRSRLRLRHFVPLAGFLVPTIVIGYGVVLPRSCAAGVNELTIGFASTLLGVAITYVAGLAAALRT